MVSIFRQSTRETHEGLKHFYCSTNSEIVQKKIIQMRKKFILQTYKKNFFESVIYKSNFSVKQKRVYFRSSCHFLLQKLHQVFFSLEVFSSAEPIVFLSSIINQMIRICRQSSRETFERLKHFSEEEIKIIFFLKKTFLENV